MISLKSQGLNVDIEVVGYEPGSDGWCGLDFHVYGNGIELYIDGNAESLLCFELEMLTKYLGLMLEGNLKEDMPFEGCMEHDFDFDFYPLQKILWIKANVLLNGRKNTRNYLHLCFDIEACQRLYEYFTQSVGVVIVKDNNA